MSRKKQVSGGRRSRMAADSSQICEFLLLLLGEQIGWANMNVKVHGDLLMRIFCRFVCK